MVSGNGDRGTVLNRIFMGFFCFRRSLESSFAGVALDWASEGSLGSSGSGTSGVASSSKTSRTSSCVSSCASSPSSTATVSSFRSSGRAASFNVHNGSPSTDGDRTNTLLLTAVAQSLSGLSSPSFATLYFEQVLAKSPKIIRT